MRNDTRIAATLIAAGDEADGGIAVDPFGHFPELVSRISGLGTGVVDSSSYAFHSPYTSLPALSADYLIRFDNLRASTGTIVFYVHEISDDPSDPVVAVQVVSVLLRDLSHAGGEQILQVNGRPHRKYAALGAIYDTTDASAEAVHIVLRSADGPPDDSKARRRAGGAGQSVARLVSQETPTLADIVSQACTPAQFEEPAYAAWTSTLDLPGVRNRTSWEQVFVLQALHRYGALRPQARGIGFALETGRVAAALAAAGVDILAVQAVAEQRGTDQETLVALRCPAVCADARFDQAVRVRTADLGGLPRDIAGYDFCWACRLLRHVTTVDAGLRFIEEALLCLRPGGILLMTADFCGEPCVPSPATNALRFHRPEIERTVLSLIALGHEVAQLRYGSPQLLHAGAQTTSIGLIVRRRSQA